MVKFDYHYINARRDLLHFVEQELDSDVIAKLGTDPVAWLDELSIVTQMLTGSGLVRGDAFYPAPEDDLDFNQIGDDVFLYRGQHGKLRGVWIREPVPDDIQELLGSGPYKWETIKFGTRAELHVNNAFSNVSVNDLLPENFESVADVVEKEGKIGKRPLFKLALACGGNTVDVYAKGADVNLSRYYDYAKPGYRLTSLAGITRTSSKVEVERTLKFGASGIAVPNVVALYLGTVEEFAFFEAVEGRDPQDYFETHKREIVKQDARMLAIMSLLGYRKQGFGDFDDKLFDGTNLYLIDVDECMDLYDGLLKGRDMLLNPRDTNELRRFRRAQRDIFIRTMRDTIFGYRDSLTVSDEEQVLYVRSFFKQMGWKDPTDGKLERMLTFPENYMTHSSYMAMMMED